MNAYDHVWLMPAQAGSGKTTLTATLVRKDYRLINDDIIPINHDGSITSLNLPLKIKSGSWQVLESFYPSLHQSKVILRSDGQKMKNLLLDESSFCPGGSRRYVTGMIIPSFDPKQKKTVIEKLSPSKKLSLFFQAEPYFTHRLTKPYLEKVLDWLEPIPAWRISYCNSLYALEIIREI